MISDFLAFGLREEGNQKSAKFMRKTSKKVYISRLNNHERATEFYWKVLKPAFETEPASCGAKQGGKKWLLLLGSKFARREIAACRQCASNSLSVAVFATGEKSKTKLYGVLQRRKNVLFHIFHLFFCFVLGEKHKKGTELRDDRVGVVLLQEN